MQTQDVTYVRAPIYTLALMLGNIVVSGSIFVLHTSFLIWMKDIVYLLYMYFSSNIA